MYDRDPRLGDVRKLQAEPMASVELHLRTGKFLDVPDTVSVLMDNKYEITFLDYSQLWHEPGSTFLYVTASDVSSLLAVPSERRGPPPAGRTSPGPLILDLGHPTTAIEYLLAELSRTVPLDVDAIDLERTRIQTNTGEELFANDVGSAQWRPGPVTNIGNLFLAGAFCRNYADVATIEGGVASGLAAAEEVRARAGVQPPITVKTADYYHDLVFSILKWMWAPYAYGAKGWSVLNDKVSTPGRNFLTTYIDTWRRVRDPGAPNGD